MDGIQLFRFADMAMPLLPEQFKEPIQGFLKDSNSDFIESGFIFLDEDNPLLEKYSTTYDKDRIMFLKHLMPDKNEATSLFFMTFDNYLILLANRTQRFTTVFGNADDDNTHFLHNLAIRVEKELVLTLSKHQLN